MQENIEAPPTSKIPAAQRSACFASETACRIGLPLRHEGFKTGQQDIDQGRWRPAGDIRHFSS
jgi:hypothetical protein